MAIVHGRRALPKRQPVSITDGKQQIQVDRPYKQLLEEFRKRSRWISSEEGIAEPGATALRSAQDVPVLLAALEAALGHHKPERYEDWGGGYLCSCYGAHSDRRLWPCPEVKDIFLALGGSSEVSPDK